MKIGIDLGTTYSAVAFMNRKGEPEAVVTGEGDRLMPSAVMFGNGQRVVVGRVAKENSLISPQNVVSTVKNDMGKQRVYSIPGKGEYTPEMISGFILKRLAESAKSYTGQDIEGAVVTIPAYFTDAQRKATKDAAALAGIRLLSIINEPTAAAIYYAHRLQLSGDANILVYDLGGGTFDATVLTVSGGNIRVRSTHGIANVGGRFLDLDIANRLCERLRQEHGIDLEDEAYIDEYNELLLKVESCKIQLSHTESAAIVIKAGGVKASLEVERSFLEQCVKKLYNRTQLSVKKAVREAGLEFKDLDKVVLVGGSSKIPLIGKSLEELTGIQASRDVNPDEAVALGAALYTTMLKDERKIVDVCSHSIGVGVVDSLDNSKLINSILIARNSALPAEKIKTFYTVTQGQKAVQLTLTEGEFKEMSDVTIISESVIPLPQELPLGTQVIIKLKLDRHQLLHVFLEVPDAHVSREYHIDRSANLDGANIEKSKTILDKYIIS